MSRAVKREFVPTTPDKYTGNYPITARSNWEYEFMTYLDRHPDVIEWASEPVQIPYTNPLNGKQTIYIPDFLVTFLQKDGSLAKKLIEIKPAHEAEERFARNGMDAAIQMKNQAKWGAATAWAMRRGIEFVIMTEMEMFSGNQMRLGRASPVKYNMPGQVKKPNPRKPKKTAAALTLEKLKKQIKANVRKREAAVAKVRKARTGRVSKVRKA